MIENLPPGFIQSINATGRQPVQLAHIHIGDYTCFYSDAPVGKTDGLMYDYEPRVESWGTLKDTSNLGATFDGDSIEARSMTLTMILTGESRAVFVDKLAYNIDNSFVEIYQWFAENPEEPPQLIDVFVIQDPIGFSERSSLFKMDLVSVIMRNNPYVWDRSVGDPVYPLVIGKAQNIPLVDHQTGKWTTTSEELEFDYLGELFIENGVGFRAGPDTIYMDSEVISYDSITASQINITGRGLNGTEARPHTSGARLFNTGQVFDYAVCCGPVADISDVMIDGEPYQNQYTIISNENPAVLRFREYPPWIRVDEASGPPVAGAPDDVTVFANTAEAYQGDGGYIPTDVNAINQEAGYCTLTYNQGGYSGEPFPYQIYADTFEINIPGGSSISYSDIYGEIDTDTGGGSLSIAADPVQGFTGGSSASIRFKNLHDWNEEFENPYFVIDTDYKFVVENNQPEAAIGTSGQLRWFFNQENAAGQASFTADILAYNTQGGDPPVYPSAELFTGRLEVPMSFPNDAGAGLPQDNMSRSEFWIYADMGTRSATEPGWDVVYPGYSYSWDTAYWELSIHQRHYETNYPWSEAMSRFDHEISGIDAIIHSATATLYFDLYDSSETTLIQIVARSIEDPSENTVLWELIRSGSQFDNEITVDLGLTNMSQLRGYRVGIRVTSPNLEGFFFGRYFEVHFKKIEWNIDYSPESVLTPYEEKVVYADDITCTVLSELGEQATPPIVIQWLLNVRSNNDAYIDYEQFYQRHLEYKNTDWYFNGVMPGDIRLHEALKMCLYEGTCRLLFSEGSIRLLTYVTYNYVTYAGEVDYDITDDIVFMRSKEINNQSTSLIENDITVAYLWNEANGVYEDTYQTKDEESIARYEQQQTRMEMKLMTDWIIANYVARYNLARKSKPIAVYSMDLFMAGYQLQKGDRVSFRSIYNGDKAGGFIAATNREFGQGKSGKINKITVEITEPAFSGPHIIQSDSVAVSDLEISGSNVTIHLRLTDSVSIADDLLTVAPGLDGAGYGGAGYGVGGYGT